MSLTITIASLRAHNACDLDARIADIRRVLPDVAEDTPVPLATWWALPSTSIPDRIWSLRAVSDPARGRVIAVTVASRAARRVLHLVREQDRAISVAAIDAAESWRAEPIPQQHRAAYAAFLDAARADTACAAFLDAAAARAAAYAACAAADTAYAADYAARAAAYAACAAADYAADYAAAYAAERACQCDELDELTKE